MEEATPLREADALRVAIEGGRSKAETSSRASIFLAGLLARARENLKLPPSAQALLLTDPTNRPRPRGSAASEGERREDYKRA
ncbi:MAG: hypothetical protein M3198_09930, partial [Actinomycetota bacterium]|nr:hypothetical protein [Actinomycetota bacterium]